MPVPIIQGFTDYLVENVVVLDAGGNNASINVWDGEVPRYDAFGNSINPDSTSSENANPINWPVVTLKMAEGGFSRQDTLADPYDDEGELAIQVWGTSRQQLEDVNNGIPAKIELAMANFAGLTTVSFSTVSNNPNPPYDIMARLVRWWCGMVEGERVLTGTQNELPIYSLLYRYDMWYEVFIHGAVPSAS